MGNSELGMRVDKIYKLLVKLRDSHHQIKGMVHPDRRDDPLLTGPANYLSKYLSVKSIWMKLTFDPSLAQGIGER